MIEQLLNAQSQLDKMKSAELPNVQLSQEDARKTMLSKIRQDNIEIATTEEKIKLVEDEVKEYEERIVETDKLLSELKGGRAEKFLEMQQKEKKMQAFIDNFDTIKHEHKEAARLVQEKIVELLKQTNQEQTSVNDVIKEDAINSKKSQQSTNDSDDLLIMLEERQQELHQLKEVKEKNMKELTNNEGKIASLKAEIAKFGNLDDLQIQWEAKCTLSFLNLKYNF
ncbi:hypothetical protein KC19_VG046900 [Ceratodon purpureus]|uniref:Uncharacterized protein n=1 Tax=Ceratodon purpureus TaxID=3225 RepID=A0A8T0HM18_CERPU|nr:hypothetical protein KC19_VG046900 [Ceratodon purpureus]